MLLNDKVRRFLTEESGQTTVEYVVMAAVVVTILMQVRGKLASILKRLLISIDEDVTEGLGNDVDL